MNKTKAIIKFCIICALTAVGVLICFLDFHVPFTSSRYISVIGAIQNKMGIDLNGGVLAVFDCKPKDGSSGTNLTDQIDATVRRIENALTSRGFVEATVVRQGNKIRIEAPGMKKTDDIFDAIGEPAEIDFRDESRAVVITAKEIKKVAVYQNPQTYEWGVRITFTKTGGDKFRAMVRDTANTNTYVYSNNGDEPWSTIKIGDEREKIGTDDTTVITLGNGATRKDADDFKLKIESGMYDVKLEPAEMSVIPPTLGKGALLGGIIALGVGLLFIFVFMYLLYGDLGLLSNLSMIIFTVLFLFAIATVGMVQLTLPGIAGIILTLGMAVDANIIIFERIKDEYKSGKRMAVAMENGFNRSVKTIFDSNITTIISALALYIFGTGAIKGFAIVLALGILVSMFCSLVITRSLAKLYLQLNPNNAKRLRFKKQERLEQAPAPTAKIRNRSLNLGDKK